MANKLYQSKAWLTKRYIVDIIIKIKPVEEDEDWLAMNIQKNDKYIQVNKTKANN